MKKTSQFDEAEFRKFENKIDDVLKLLQDMSSEKDVTHTGPYEKA